MRLGLWAPFWKAARGFIDKVLKCKLLSDRVAGGSLWGGLLCGLWLPLLTFRIFESSKRGREGGRERGRVGGETKERTKEGREEGRGKGREERKKKEPCCLN